MSKTKTCEICKNKFEVKQRGRPPKYCISCARRINIERAKINQPRYDAKRKLMGTKRIKPNKGDHANPPKAKRELLGTAEGDLPSKLSHKKLKSVIPKQNKRWTRGRKKKEIEKFHTNRSNFDLVVIQNPPLKCDECGGKVEYDKHRSEHWCIECGLVQEIDPNEALLKFLQKPISKYEGISSKLYNESSWF
jgi:predicted RNA-binding Zn-ribbon protein involved in translation (DUF1610 family)